MKDFRAIVALWPTRAAFAQEVGVSQFVVQQWVHRDSIPAAKFNDVVRAANKAGHPGITHRLLADLAEQRRADGRQATA